MWSVAAAAWQTLVLGTGVVKDAVSSIVVGTQLHLWRHDCNFWDTAASLGDIMTHNI